MIELKLLSQSGNIVTYEFIVESEQRGQVQYNFESGQYRVEQQTITKYPTSYLVHLIAKLAEFSNLNQFPNSYTIAWY
ncbi:hypothetical protein JCM14202_1585 [Agrilactobacillus composti DSM 18527 = JCM 14202]|uniref:hypothetical protein n=1 Tax=Agrilactobacillus composti TaxID=398555 RepID=UPI00042E11C7|nr:hypothetical protein [Agrilactobacillus composti]GAF39714.1 hypothetical protein JCM14202_1585 [Agrilactobacillus composti DSM 18527 = JCM 14202]